jgi:hypothetical protein
MSARGNSVVLQPHPSAARVQLAAMEELGRPVSAACWPGCAEANGSRCLRRAIAEGGAQPEARICGAMTVDLLAGCGATAAADLSVSLYALAALVPTPLLCFLPCCATISAEMWSHDAAERRSACR